MLNVKLGKSPKRTDHRTLKLGNYLKTADLPALPDSFDWATIGVPIPDFGMMRNDELGDCTCASAGHLIMRWTADNGNLFVPTDQQIVDAYSAITGYNPANPATDQGANELYVLSYWKNTGIAGHNIGAYAEIDVSRTDLIKYAIYLFGGAYLGVELPLAYQGAASWDTPADLNGNNAPGSWGGHAIPAIAWDENWITIITWGKPLKMSWGAWAAYGEESYAILSPDLVTGAKTSPDGFDLTTLQADLQSL
jgi:hypothetical protein